MVSLVFFDEEAAGDWGRLLLRNFPRAIVRPCQAYVRHSALPLSFGRQSGRCFASMTLFQRAEDSSGVAIRRQQPTAEVEPRSGYWQPRLRSLGKVSRWNLIWLIYRRTGGCGRGRSLCTGIFIANGLQRNRVCSSRVRAFPAATFLALAPVAAVEAEAGETIGDSCPAEAGVSVDNSSVVAEEAPSAAGRFLSEVARGDFASLVAADLASSSP